VAVTARAEREPIMDASLVKACMACASSAAFAAAAGWAVRGAQAPSAAPVVLAAAVRPPAAPSPDAANPFGAVGRGGHVTQSVEQPPIASVPDRIGLQDGAVGAEPRARPDPPSGAPALAALPDKLAACAHPPVDAARMLQAIEHASEAERFDALSRARNAQVAVPDVTLRRLYETESSDRVALVALSIYLDRESAETKVLRPALEAALTAASAAVQSEARRRLDELAETERILAESPQGVSP
jgi:hypothetical protein